VSSARGSLGLEGECEAGLEEQRSRSSLLATYQASRLVQWLSIKVQKEKWFKLRTKLAVSHIPVLLTEGVSFRWKSVSIHLL